MKRKCCTTICLFISSVFLVFGLSGVLGGIFGNAWWIYDQTNTHGWKYENGLLRYKHTVNGKEKSGFIGDVFEFTNNAPTVLGINGEQRDMILSCLIVSAFLALSAFFPLLCGACRMVERSWDCSTLLMAFFTSTSAVPAIGAMVYVELRLDDRWEKLSDRKECWSYMMAWVGTGSLFLSSVLSFALICMRPRRGAYSIGKKQTSHMARSNVGFEEDGSKPVQTVLVKKKGPRTILESAA